jgi:hypothetical protein
MKIIIKIFIFFIVYFFTIYLIIVGLSLYGWKVEKSKTSEIMFRKAIGKARYGEQIPIYDNIYWRWIREGIK